MLQNNSSTNQSKVKFTVPPTGNTEEQFVNSLAELSNHCDWLAFTAWGFDKEAFYDSLIWAYTNKEAQDFGHGGNFYRQTWGLPEDFLVRSDPIGRDCDPSQTSVEIHGKLCQIMGYEGLKRVIECIQDTCDRYTITRFDLAIDNCPFTPKQLFDSIDKNHIRSTSQRETLTYYSKPHEVNEAGHLGTSGVNFGNRASARYLRCYDQHGYTRFELEYKEEYAKGACIAYFQTGDLNNTVFGLVRDFIDVLDDDIDNLREQFGTRVDLGQHLADWWAKFTGQVTRVKARAKGTLKSVTLDSITEYLRRQVSSAFSTLVDVGQVAVDDLVDMLMVDGRQKRGNNLKYRVLLDTL